MSTVKTDAGADRAVSTTAAVTEDHIDETLEAEQELCGSPSGWRSGTRVERAKRALVQRLSDRSDGTTEGTILRVRKRTKGNAVWGELTYTTADGNVLSDKIRWTESLDEDTALNRLCDMHGVPRGQLTGLLNRHIPLNDIKKPIVPTSTSMPALLIYYAHQRVRGARPQSLPDAPDTERMKTLTWYALVACGLLIANLISAAIIVNDASPAEGGAFVAAHTPFAGTMAHAVAGTIGVLSLLLTTVTVAAVGVVGAFVAWEVGKLAVERAVEYAWPY